MINFFCKILQTYNIFFKFSLTFSLFFANNVLVAQKIIPKKVDFQEVNKKDTDSIPIGFVNKILKNQKPNSYLGNFIADAVKYEMENILKKRIDFVYISSSAIRGFLNKGNVYKYNVEQILPFQDSLCYMEVDGNDILRLFQNIALKGGEPISGAQFQIKNMNAINIVIDGDSLDIHKKYSLVTIQRNANGKENCSMLIDYTKVVFTNTLTSTLIKYIQNLTYEARPIIGPFERRISYKND